MKLVILGSTGQVGWELQRALAPLGQVTALDRAAADLSRPDALRAALDLLRPDVIVNAAAYTAVDAAERERDAAFAVNSTAVACLADVARDRDAVLVHYSTDYVFDGSAARPYAETDPTNPLGVYGESKRDGELAIQRLGPRHLIFRCSWVHAPRGANFIRTVLRLARERSELRIVSDQVGAPTPADLIADVTAHALRTALSAAKPAWGTYHLASSGETSWHGVARLVVEEALRLGADLKADTDSVLPITTADYPTAARRPASSRLDTGKLRAAFALELPPWQQGVARTVAELLA